MTDTIIAIAAVITALTIIVTAVFKIYKIAKRLDGAIGVDSKGETAVQRMESKLDTHASDVTHRLGKVEYQLFPNGGGSLVDKVNRNNDALIEMKAELGVVKSLLHTLVENNERTVAHTHVVDQVPAPEPKPRLRKTTSKSNPVRK